MPSTFMPLCTATMTSETVDMPTASAPIVRDIRISAGVSYVGPEKAHIHAFFLNQYFCSAATFFATSRYSCV